MELNPSSPTQLVRVSLLSALLGGGIGVVVKLLDESSIANHLGINDLGTYWGMWIVLATILSVSSISQQAASARVLVFFLAMLTAYYSVTRLMFGFFPTSYFLIWIVIALFFTPLYAILVWHGKQVGWMAGLSAAIPVGLLLWEAYSFRFVFHIHTTQFVFDILAAITLFLTLPPTRVQHVRTIVLVPSIMLVAEIVNRIVPFILGALHPLF